MPQDTYSIYVENLHLPLSNDKLNEIITTLKQHEIDIIFSENLEPKASLFSAISIIFNEPLVKQIILNLFSAGVFEAIKISLLHLYNCLKKFKNISSNGKQEQSSLNIRLKTDNITLNLPIPNNLHDEQFLAYLDMAQNTLIEIGKSDIIKST